ncbi:hypothetical protein NPIL_541581 [Nephila pilipes]|uniref:Uncharacterized protein n=1 Tax=Nephila pilipes TaxID=299642 RepID=A0A8X6NWP4_NEPPI|nr:hypothetical protein NPIL_541581 [Nephila pilipes]
MLEFTETKLLPCLLGKVANSPLPLSLRTSELHSLFFTNINTIWRTPHQHGWYAALSLGSLDFLCSAPLQDLLRPLYLDLELVTPRV